MSGSPDGPAAVGPGRVTRDPRRPHSPASSKEAETDAVGSLEMLGAWPPLPQPPGGEKVRSGLGGAPPPEPIPAPWRSPQPVGEGPGGGRQAGRGGGAASGLARPRGPGGRAPALRAPTSGPSGPSDRVTSRSPAARPPGALDAMKQLCLCAASSFAVGPGEGARGGVLARALPPLPAPPRPLTARSLDPPPADPRGRSREDSGSGGNRDGRMDGTYGETILRTDGDT